MFYPLSSFISCGNCGVDIFLFLSGACLSLSFNKKERVDYREYYKKRIGRVLIPYAVISLPYWIWKSVIEHPEKTVFRAILHITADFSSATFWLKGTQTTWFVFGICVFYLLFPLLYKIVRRSKRTALLLLIISLSFGFVTSFIPIIKHSNIVWARLPIFISGIIIGVYFLQLSFRNINRMIIIVCSLTVVIMFCFLFSLRNFLGAYPVLLWTCYGILGIAVMISFTLCFPAINSGRVGLAEWALSIIGHISLELYLVHVPALHILRYFGILAKAGKWNYLILPIISVPFAYLGGKVSTFFSKKLLKGSI